MNTSNAPASSNASSMPAGVAPQIDVNGLLSAMALKSQIDKTNAETRNIDAQKKLKRLLMVLN